MSLLADLRYALRMFGKTPSFSVTVVLTFAIGIAVNVAVFTLLHAALLGSLPVREPRQLAQIVTFAQPTGNQSDLSYRQQTGNHSDFSYPLYVDLRDASSSLDALAAYASAGVGVAANGISDRVIAEFVTANYFRTLGVDLAAGPGFAGADELNGAPPTAILSDRLWAAMFDRNPGVFTQPIDINGQRVAVVGVAPRMFEGMVRGQRADLWLTVAQFGPLRQRGSPLPNRNQSWLSLVGRVRRGTTWDQAAAELTGAVRASATTGASGWTARLLPAATGDASLVEGLSTPLRLLMATVSLILLIASANVANLLLARGFARQSEIALRRALGASRRRIVQALVVESVTLALAGGVVGSLAGWWALALIEVRSSAGTLLALRLEPNAPIAAFAAALSIGAAIAAGILPAWTSSRPELISVIKASEGTASPGRRRMLRAAFTVVQIALSMVLVVGAGLFLRTLAKLRAIDPSIRDSRVVAATVNLTLRGLDETRGRQFYLAALDAVRAAPGIQAASFASALPATQGGTRIDVIARSTVPVVDHPVGVDIVSVSPGFFQTTALPLLRGRDVTVQDSASSEPAIIVNETMEKTFWTPGDATGRTFSIAGQTLRVVGVARDTKYRSLRETPRMTMYMPLAQSYESAVTLVVRSTLSTDAAVVAMRTAVGIVDPRVPLYNVRTLMEHVERSLYFDRLRANLISLLAGLALVLAAIGIYGVVSYSVTERTRELGIRLSLGAPRASVAALLLKSGSRLVGAGVAAGILLSLAFTRVAAEQLYGITRTDGATFAGAAAVLAATALVATIVPALRAMRIDPIAALRHE